MPKILIVDDERHIIELISVLLEDMEDFEIIKAYDGDEALEMVVKHHPELVLLDYMMPKKNGLEVLKEIKAQFKECYVVIMTGKGSEKVAVELMKAGASDYLPKPFKADELIEVVESVLKFRMTELERRTLESAGPSITTYRRMVTGYNENIVHQGKTYHIQTEDYGAEQGVVKSFIYESGMIVSSREIDYSRFNDRTNLSQIVSTVVKRLHHQMVEDLLIGKFEQNGRVVEPSPH
ncbi:response regulator [bacterium]|nr:response regulator [bacterium]